MAADGVDMGDERAVQEWIGRYNALLDPGDLLPLPEPVVLPPVSLADGTELRQLAAAAPLVVRVGVLLSHVGPNGRTTTQTGALRMVDGTALAEACGDVERLHRPDRWERPVRRMADLPGVTEAYELALESGLLDVVGTRVRRDPSRPGADDVLPRGRPGGRRPAPGGLRRRAADVHGGPG